MYYGFYQEVMAQSKRKKCHTFASIFKYIIFSQKGKGHGNEYSLLSTISAAVVFILSK